jgi:hypothetical protein
MTFFRALAVAATIISYNGVSGRELATRHEAIHKNSKRLPQTATYTSTSSRLSDHPGVANCTLNYYTQQIDHFNFASTPTGATTYQQRYFTYDQYWKKDETG